MTKKLDAWNDGTPDTSCWTPRLPANSKNLKHGLQLSCRVIQQRLIAEANAEQRFNIDNFDSGSGLEDLVRRELRRLLPTRYDIVPGVVNDADGRTAGDCDVAIANGLWAPLVKLGATEESRRRHIPIESVYSIIEVKQSASYSALDDAMQKLVCAGRLKRADNPYGHITENQHIKALDKDHFILNPLHSVALLIGSNAAPAFDDLAKRFFHINSLIAAATGRNSMVKMLCALGGGVAYYTVQNDSGYVEADFCRDRSAALIETTMQIADESFYAFFIALLGHLTRSVLHIVEIPVLYGSLSSLSCTYHRAMAAPR